MRPQCVAVPRLCIGLSPCVLGMAIMLKRDIGKMRILKPQPKMQCGQIPPPERIIRSCSVLCIDKGRGDVSPSCPLINLGYSLFTGCSDIQIVPAAQISRLYLLLRYPDCTCCSDIQTILAAQLSRLYRLFRYPDCTCCSDIQTVPAAQISRLYLLLRYPDIPASQISSAIISDSAANGFHTGSPAPLGSPVFMKLVQ